MEVLDPKERRESPVAEVVMASLVKTDQGVLQVPLGPQVQLAHMEIRENLVQPDPLVLQVAAVVLVNEVNKAPLDLLASLEPPDKMGNLVEKEREALVVKEVSLVRQELQVLKEALVHQVQLVPKDQKESVVVQAALVQLVSQVLEACLVPLV